MSRVVCALILLAACSYKHGARAQAGPGLVASEADDRILAEGSEEYVADLDVQIAQAAAVGDPVVAVRPDRLMIRKGMLRLRTANPDEVGRRAVQLVQEAGGWVQQQRDRSFLFRIPAAGFDSVLGSIEAMGAVAARQIDAQDVTEEVHDLELRIRNARALRDRYAELLKRAKKVEEILDIERELAKVTTEIERLEGQLKRRKHDVAFSVLRLLLEAPSSAPAAAARSPFDWLTRIGIENVPRFRPDRARSSRVSWDAPEGFADMGRTDDHSIRGWLYSPDGIRIVVREFDNKPRVDAGFWSRELERELVKVRGYEPERPQAGGVLRFRSVSGGAPTSYAVKLIVHRGDLVLVEVVGPREEVEKAWAVIGALFAQVEDWVR